jgi:acetoin utilization protein AcuC
MPRASAVLIASDIYRRSRYGGKHPLSIQRVAPAVDLARALGWVPDGAYIESPQASVAELCRFHDRDYVEAVMRAEASQSVTAAEQQRYNIGCAGNPVFPEVFRRPATACGGTLKAAELLAEPGPDAPVLAYNPAGGTHHGRPGRASGFCYFNDPVLGILRLLDLGVRRVLYLDVDAHHGDGVEAAFVGESRVATISIHEAGRWPYTGAAADRGGGQSYNFPVPPGFNDSEFEFLLETAVGPIARSFRPEIVVMQGGCDGLAEDPLSRLELSNRALIGAAEFAASLAPKLLLLGGGGYNPWAVARCWAAMWGKLTGNELPDRIGEAGRLVLARLEWPRLRQAPPAHWLETLCDAPRPGPIRPEIRALVAGLAARGLAA